MDSRRLWAAVILQSIKDLTGYCVVSRERDRIRLQRFARAWFLSSRYDPGSFLWACDAAGLEPCWIRRRLKDAIGSTQAGKDGAGRVTFARLQQMFEGADDYIHG